MKLSKTYEGFKVFHKEKEVIIVPWVPANQMKFKEGEFEVRKIKDEEPGLWVARSPEGMGPDTALVYETKPYMSSGDWAIPGLIRTFCWPLFRKVTSIELQSGEIGKFAIIGLDRV